MQVLIWCEDAQEIKGCNAMIVIPPALQPNEHPTKVWTAPCYLINWICMSVICHPCPPDQGVFYPARVPYQDLPTVKATCR